MARRRISRRTLRDTRNGLLFALPYIIGFSCFTVYPIGASLYYSFTTFGVFSAPKWAGLANYVEMLSGTDDYFWLTLCNTLYYTVFSVSLGIVVGVGIALLLNIKVKEMALYRTVFFLPVLVPAVASSILWLWILNPQFGLVNAFLYRVFGITGPGWIADEKWSKPSLVLMSLWGTGQAVVVYLAGLQEIPQQLYEAAELDGAGVWRRTRAITIPMLTPVIFFNLVMGLIGAFQTFTQAYIMTDGGPANSTLFYMLHLYRQGFSYFRMGYASALAWVLFTVILSFTLAVFRTSGWVYYAGATR